MWLDQKKEIRTSKLIITINHTILVPGYRQIFVNFCNPNIRLHYKMHYETSCKFYQLKIHQQTLKGSNRSNRHRSPSARQQPGVERNALKCRLKGLHEWTASNVLKTVQVVNSPSHRPFIWHSVATFLTTAACLDLGETGCLFQKNKQVTAGHERVFILFKVWWCSWLFFWSVSLIITIKRETYCTTYTHGLLYRLK